jgi:hypothetical protein
MSIQTQQESTELDTQETESPQQLSKNEVFELLSNERRRYAIHHVKQSDGAVELGALSEQVAAWENSGEVSGVSSDERKSVYTSLQQFHLPKMEREGVVEFDDRQGTVELSPRAEDLDVYLEVVEGYDIPWSEYYLGLSAISLALVVSAAADIYPIALVSGTGWAIFTAVTFLVSALVHTYISRTEMRLESGDQPPEVGE